LYSMRYYISRHKQIPDGNARFPTGGRRDPQVYDLKGHKDTSNQPKSKVSRD